ncbi:MAG: alpha/beta hydrolase [Lachnospiraceae bacterium]|nr:alpha/beta hydrolase [Lachnospiraceae bacterium]
MGILIIIILIFLLLLIAAGFWFIKMSLKATPTRKEDVLLPKTCTDEPKPGNEKQLQFIANRTRIRAEGAEFDKTLTPVEIVNKSGLKLFGRYRFNDTATHNWIISVHGYRDDHRFMLPYIMRFFDAGYNVFTQDNRAHGLSDGDYISMGWFDKDDVYEWLDCIVRMDPDARIIVHGVSMGAATTMMLSGLNHPAVIGYIEDCGYTSTWNMFKVCLNRDYHLPTFPLLNVCNLINRLRLGYDYRKSSAIDQIKKCSKPMMFIHGAEDDFIPPSMCDELYDAFEGKKEKYLAPFAGHAESMDYDPDEYFRRIFDFIDNVIMQG